MTTPNDNQSKTAPAGSRAAECSADIWRVTADDDKEKEWDSNNPDDAFIDAENAFDDGERKVTIERISPPNRKLSDEH